MKAVILVIALAIILILAGQANAQVRPDLKRILDAAISNAKASALNARSVKWDSVQTVMFQTAADAKSVADLRESFEVLLVALNDKHGVFYDPTTNMRIAAYPEGEAPEISAQMPVHTGGEKVNLEYHILHHDVRYLRLVATPLAGDLEKQATMIRQAVDSLNKEDARFWIIDLRYAVGGDMNPLFAGLGPLLNEGLIATTVDGKEQIKDLYTVHNGNFYHNQVPVARFPLFTKDMRAAKVAVLTSKQTSGAAEIVALALKGRKNTKLFGETTAGKIACNRTFNFSNNLSMSIAETIFTDRKGTLYKDSIEPDTFIEFTPGVSIKHDKAITEASLWLTTSSLTETGAKVTMK